MILGLYLKFSIGFICGKEIVEGGLVALHKFWLLKRELELSISNRTRKGKSICLGKDLHQAFFQCSKERRRGRKTNLLKWTLPEQKKLWIKQIKNKARFNEELFTS